MKTLMSNLPDDQTIVLNPKTNKPLVRGKNGRFIKSDAGDGDIPSQSNTSAGLNTTTDDQYPNYQSVDQTNTLNQTPSGYVSAPGKETSPNLEEIYLEEAKRTQELKEGLAELEKTAEVKEIKGEIELPEMVKQAGVEQIGEETPVIEEESSAKLPLADDRIYKIVKRTNPIRQDTSSSLTWWAYWCWRQLSLLHIKLKDMHGKIIRIVNKPQAD